MKILVDENIERWLRLQLELQGHDVAQVGREVPLSSPDDVVLSASETTDRIVLTRDKDFGYLVFVRKLTHQSVVLLRLGDLAREEQMLLILRGLDAVASEPGSYWVVTPGGHRRGAP